MKIADMKVTDLINAVGSDAPAPGGGAVAGLAGGIGVAYWSFAARACGSGGNRGKYTPANS